MVDDEMTSLQKPLREWRITLVPRKGRYLGRVEAPDAATAIEHAMAEFDFDEAHRSRLIAQPETLDRMNVVFLQMCTALGLTDGKAPATEVVAKR